MSSPAGPLPARRNAWSLYVVTRSVTAGVNPAYASTQSFTKLGLWHRNNSDRRCPLT